MGDLAKCASGEFNSKEKAWLVLWEAGLVIEVPPGALIYYPSALFTHFNVNLTGRCASMLTINDH